MQNNDLISRSAAIAEIEEYIEEYSELDENGYHNLKWCAMEEAKETLLMMPAIDAVEVIRCRDCKYAHMTYDGEVKYCDRISMADEDGDYGYALYLPGDWYCADGEWRCNDGK